MDDVAFVASPYAVSLRCHILSGVQILVRAERFLP